MVPTQQIAELNSAINAARLPELPNGEMKWSKVSAAKLPAYKRVVDVFFKFSRPPHRTEFHSLFVDTSRILDKKFNEGSREIGFNKEVFQIVRKCALMHNKRLLNVYLDYRDTESTPEKLRYILNCHLKKIGDKRDWPFRRIHFRDSKESQCLQLVDVLLGSVAFQLNGHGSRLGASVSKIELAEYIRARVPYHSALLGTHRSGKFTIWERKLQK